MADSAATWPGDVLRVPVASDCDVIIARQQGRLLAESLGFSRVDGTLVATAISELARNIVLYAKRGDILMCGVSDPCGISVIARDQGPGISDIESAMRIGYSSSGGLGLGLPGVRRIMDQFEIHSSPGLGTSVTVVRWRRK